MLTRYFDYFEVQQNVIELLTLKDVIKKVLDNVVGVDWITMVKVRSSYKAIDYLLPPLPFLSPIFIIIR